MAEPRNAPEELEAALLGGDRRYTRAEVARRTGVPLERAERLWRALGFAGVADDEVVFTDDDVDALVLLARLVEQGAIDQDAEASLARSLGQTLARLADWQTMLIREAASGSDGASPDVVGTARSLAPALERLQSYAWRRHLVAAAGRLLPVSSADPRSATLVVGFADIVGFTRYSRTSNDAELAALVEHFEAAGSEVVVAHGGRVIKMIGDEVLFIAYTPTSGADIALELASRSRDDAGFPRVRVGLAYGTVLSRLGDVYGPVVNVAARLTSLARPRTVLCDRALMRVLADDPRYGLRRQRRVSVRGYARLEPWVLRSGGGS
ncbi:MAG: adenylate/guanylate cyclase domain-containing protein [Streptosporangiales bacterium]